MLSTGSPAAAVADPPFGREYLPLLRPGLSKHGMTVEMDPASGRAASTGAAPPSPAVLDFNSVLSQRYAQLNNPVPLAPPASATPMTGTETGAPPKRVKASLKKSSASPSTNSYSSPSARAEIPTLRYADLGGIEEVVEEIRDVVERPFRYGFLYRQLGVEAPRGVLLHGVPGCGKTSLVMAMAGELGIPLLKVAAPELVAGMSGESEGRIRDLFESARAAAPCLLFIDEIDAITPKRETAQREMERRIVAQLLACMDDLSHPPRRTGETADSSIGASGELEGAGASSDLAASASHPIGQGSSPGTGKPIVTDTSQDTLSRHVMVIGATNRPDALDPALRRAGRFDREIALTIPNEAARRRILQVLCQRMRLSGSLDLATIARNTPGFVGADLKALTQEAAAVTIKRLIAMAEQERSNPSHPPEQDEMTEEAGGAKDPSPHLSAGVLAAELVAVEVEDFAIALKKIQPSAKREGFAIVPNTRWEDIGALQYVRSELRMAVVEPLRHPEKFAAVGLTAPAGVLLWGPPGCGKTLLAKAVANESHSNFISVKGPELLSKYVGESERAVRQVFERARHSAPCIVFFDELDALCPRRRNDESDVAARVVNQLLTEMDGLEDRRQVFILAATNRPDMIDPAMMRPGRLDKLLYVNLPDDQERGEILRAVGRATPWAPDVDLVAVARDPRCEAFSGADLAALVREASMAAVRESIEGEAIQEDTMMITDGDQRSDVLASEGGNHPRNGADHDVCLPSLTLRVTKNHIEYAFARVTPSVSPIDLRSYEKLRLEKFRK